MFSHVSWLAFFDSISCTPLVDEFGSRVACLLLDAGHCMAVALTVHIPSNNWCSETHASMGIVCMLAEIRASISPEAANLIGIQEAHIVHAQLQKCQPTSTMHYFPEVWSLQTTHPSRGLKLRRATSSAPVQCSPSTKQEWRVRHAGGQARWQVGRHTDCIRHTLLALT